jgi:hypothetical protein
MESVQGWIKGMGRRYGTLGIAIALGACAPISSAPLTALVPSVSPSQSAIAPAKVASAKTTPAKTTPAKTPTSRTPPTTTVLIYQADRQCLKVMPTKVVLPAQNSLDRAIARILDSWDNADFALAGYRVTTASGIAIVDFRLAPGAKRQLSSLSNCEQLGLLGSIRKTLTANSQWQIQEVQFTQQGKALL